jgi:flagellar biosynthetic protein FliR
MISLLNIAVFWMLAARLTGFFALAPGVQDLQVPKLVRVALIVWLSCFMTPLVPRPPAIDLGWTGLVTGVALEFCFGLGLGLVTRLVISAVQVGGSLMDNDLSLSAAQQLNPQLVGISGGVMGRVLLIVGLAYFWFSDYLSALLIGLRESFRVLPLGTVGVTHASLELMVRLCARLFEAGLLVAAPIALLIFIATMALGFLSRSVQQLNVFSESFVIRVIVGGAGVVFLLPLLLLLTRYSLERMLPAAAEYFQAMT